MGLNVEIYQKWEHFGILIPPLQPMKKNQQGLKRIVYHRKTALDWEFESKCRDIKIEIWDWKKENRQNFWLFVSLFERSNIHQNFRTEAWLYWKWYQAQSWDRNLNAVRLVPTESVPLAGKLEKEQALLIARWRFLESASVFLKPLLPHFSGELLLPISSVLPWLLIVRSIEVWFRLLF